MLVLFIGLLLLLNKQLSDKLEMATTDIGVDSTFTLVTSFGSALPEAAVKEPLATAYEIHELAAIAQTSSGYKGRRKTNKEKTKNEAKSKEICFQRTNKPESRHQKQLNK
jgi:ribosomal protein L12E/L44/L45/RPP1/RPP2